MTQEQSGTATATPPAGSPSAVPPATVAPTTTQAPVPVQQPPVETPPPARTFTPPPTAAPPQAVPAATPPAAPGTTELLGNLEALKPTVESLKIPEGIEYPKEFLSDIASSSQTIDEAQKRFDTAHKLFTTMQQGLAAKNSEWISSLKQDSEVGGTKWEGSLDLYRKGVVEEFGVDFAKRLASSKLDAEPNFFKAVVRRMRAKSPKPVVNGEQTPPPATDEPKTTEEFAKKTYAGMGTGYKTAPQRKGPGW